MRLCERREENKGEFEKRGKYESQTTQTEEKKKNLDVVDEEKKLDVDVDQEEDQNLLKVN